MKRLPAIVFLVLIFCVPSGAQTILYPNQFSLKDVQLLDGPFLSARDLNIKVLLEYKTDRLLAPFRKEAGLPIKDSSYKNWDGLDGHVGGHYLSSLAINYASTNDPSCKQRMEYMISELKACQVANTNNHSIWGIGYVGSVPNSQAVWSDVAKGDFQAYHAAWVPWYNVHKLFAGLRDAWIYANNEEARSIFIKFCDWAIAITNNLSDAQMQSMLDTEHGGMAEIFSDAYQITHDGKYLLTAKRFSHRQLLDPMSAKTDNLDNKHANTQVAKAIGFARIAELSGENNYATASKFFWETVVSKHTLAFGGNSRREFFPSAAASSDFINDVEGPETCNSYNMLKLTEDLFRQQPDVKYIDYYERTLYNHILSSQHPVTGGYVYFTPARPRHYRVYSSPNEAMWCCVGSGMENHGKYNEFIYTHSHDSLYINLFVPSTLNWKERGIMFRQETKFPFEEATKFIVAEGSANLSLLIRYPSWVSDGQLKVFINGKAMNVTQHPSSYIGIKRAWKKGDVVEIKLPMHTSIEHLPYLPEYIAFMKGPILLGAKTGQEDLKGLIANDGRWGHIASGEKLSIDKAPIIISDDPSGLSITTLTQPLHYAIASAKIINPINVELQPFFQIHDSRYMMYWMALSSDQYQSYLDSIQLSEKQALMLEHRTIDALAPGEQQPEADHSMISERSNKGVNQDHLFRDASNGGSFSYLLKTNNLTSLSLMLRYWGAEWNERKFDIYIDDQKLSTVINTGRWNQSKFIDVEYDIPSVMINGKDQIRVKFIAITGASVSPIYHLRLLSPIKSQ